MISKGRFADKFGSAPHEEYICQRAKDVELFIMSFFGHDFLRTSYVGTNTYLNSYTQKLH